jgi:hypothetical protein
MPLPSLVVVPSSSNSQQRPQMFNPELGNRSTSPVIGFFTPQARLSNIPGLRESSVTMAQSHFTVDDEDEVEFSLMSTPEPRRTSQNKGMSNPKKRRSSRSRSPTKNLAMSDSSDEEEFFLAPASSAPRPRAVLPGLPLTRPPLAPTASSTASAPSLPNFAAHGPPRIPLGQRVDSGSSTARPRKTSEASSDNYELDDGNPSTVGTIRLPRVPSATGACSARSDTSGTDVAARDHELSGHASYPPMGHGHRKSTNATAISGPTVSNISAFARGGLPARQ